MEDYFALRKYFIDMAIYHVENNLNFNSKIRPENFEDHRDSILYHIGRYNFYEALKELNKHYPYRYCPAKGSLWELLKLEEYLKKLRLAL